MKDAVCLRHPKSLVPPSRTATPQQEERHLLGRDGLGEQAPPALPKRRPDVFVWGVEVKKK